MRASFVIGGFILCYAGCIAVLVSSTKSGKKFILCL